MIARHCLPPYLRNVFLFDAVCCKLCGLGGSRNYLASASHFIIRSKGITGAITVPNINGLLRTHTQALLYWLLIFLLCIFSSCFLLFVCFSSTSIISLGKKSPKFILYSCIERHTNTQCQHIYPLQVRNESLGVQEDIPLDKVLLTQALVTECGPSTQVKVDSWLRGGVMWTLWPAGLVK